MKQIDGLKLKGQAIIERRKLDGTIIDREIINNIIVDTGKERVAKLLNGVSTTYFGFIGIGIGTNPPATSQTSLQSQIKREAATLSYEANYKTIFEKTFSFASTYTITEAGIFSLAVGGVMLDRFTFTGKEVNDVTTLYIKVTITIS